jgi:hypothetical protein
MGGRRPLQLLAALLLGALARADAALLESVAGCTLKPAQHLRVVAAEPTKLTVSNRDEPPFPSIFRGRGRSSRAPAPRT